MVSSTVWCFQCSNSILPSVLAKRRKILPERLIEMAVEYPIVIIAPKEEVSMDLIFHNRVCSNENMEVWIDSQPKKWEARIKN